MEDQLLGGGKFDAAEWRLCNTQRRIDRKPDVILELEHRRGRHAFDNDSGTGPKEVVKRHHKVWEGDSAVRRCNTKSLSERLVRLTYQKWAKIGERISKTPPRKSS